MNLGTHLHPVGEEVKAEVELGFGSIRKGMRRSTSAIPRITAIRVRMRTRRWTSRPAGWSRADGYTLHTKPGKIIAFQPHMHIRGKYQCIELIYPSIQQDHEARDHQLRHWDYNWHLVYNYADDVAPIVPAGTIVHIISWHDNSRQHARNPDPKNWVGYGQRTIDEMGFAWIGWIDLTQEEYEQELAARKARLSRPGATGAQP